MEDLSELVSAAKSGDGAAFGRIVARFQGMAYAGAYARLGDHHLAQDAAQEAFVDAYLSLGNLRQAAAFPGWFRRFVVKHAERQYRKKRPAALDPAVVQTLPSEWPDPELMLARSQERQGVQAAIAALPASQREATLLFHIEGYSQKEIAQFLEVPIGTIKKRLFDARKGLRKRMLDMVKETMQENKPDELFADKVQFFIALREGNMARLAEQVDKNPDLLEVRTEWTVSSEGHYWPLHVTPLFYAAGTGDGELLEFLLDRGAKIDERSQGGDSTPLHYAVLAGQLDAAALLLDRGAEVDAACKNGQVPLHRAVLRQNADMAGLLLDRGAAVDAKDADGRTPADWAAIKGHGPLVDLLVDRGARRPAAVAPTSPLPAQGQGGRQVPVGPAVLGRVLDATGKPKDGHGALKGAEKAAVYGSLAGGVAPVLETGIKIVDLLAPITRGGHVGLFTPMSGVGKLIVMGQICQNVALLHNGCIVYLGQEDAVYTAEDMLLAWRGDFGMDNRIMEERMSWVFAQADDPAAKKQQAAETALTMAEHLRRQGREVLLVVEAPLALVEGVQAYLRTHAVAAPEGAVTTLYVGHYTVGLEPEDFAGLNGIITFSHERARQALYPAVDPLRSRSALLDDPLYDPEHRRLAAETRRVFSRYHELHHQYENRGFEAFFYLHDREQEERLVVRARRLHRFLTQPFVGTEPFTAIPGVMIPLSETLKGCGEILAGKHDGVVEDAFNMVGGMDEVSAKAGDR